MYAAQESESLQRSSQMVSDLTSLSQSILGDLGEQRSRMKVRTRLLVRGEGAVGIDLRRRIALLECAHQAAGYRQ